MKLGSDTVIKMSFVEQSPTSIYSASVISRDFCSSVLAGNNIKKKHKTYYFLFRHISNRNTRGRKCAISCSLTSESIYKLTWLETLLFQKACEASLRSTVSKGTSTRLTRCSGAAMVLSSLCADQRSDSVLETFCMLKELCSC